MQIYTPTHYQSQTTILQTHIGCLTIETIKGFELNRKFRVVGVEETELGHGPQTKEFTSI